MRYRVATTGDLSACHELLSSGGRFDWSPDVRRSLIGLWRRLMVSGRIARPSFVVWEDVAEPAATRLQAFSIGLFVHDDVLDAELADRRPYLANRIYERILAGEHPDLTTREVGDANARGQLNLVILHYVQRYHDLSHPKNQPLLPLGPAAWHFSYAGYRMKRILWEVYGESHRDNMHGWGFQLADAFDPVAQTMPDSQPYLFTLEKGAVKPAAFDAMAVWVFHPPVPTLGLAPAHQRVVLQALQGDTDRAIARKFGVSEDAIKQAWRSIVGRTSDAMASGSAPESTTPSAVRGAERRRVALEYLRQHMEELRPWRRAAT